MLRNGDKAQKELILWLLANCIADSSLLSKILVEKLDFVDILVKLCDQEKLKKDLLKTILWNLQNLAAKHLLR